MSRTDRMVVPTAEKTIWTQAILLSRRHSIEVPTLGMVSSVNDLHRE